MSQFCFSKACFLASAKSESTISCSSSSSVITGIQPSFFFGFAGVAEKGLSFGGAEVAGGDADDAQSTLTPGLRADSESGTGGMQGREHDEAVVANHVVVVRHPGLLHHLFRQGELVLAGALGNNYDSNPRRRLVKGILT